jgi:Zn-dependent peptidase ImmA (M78 family)
MKLKVLPINISRLDYLLEMFNWNREYLLNALNTNRKRLYCEEDLFSGRIRLSTLKQIDSFFKVGIPFYMEPDEINNKRARSIFFRKTGLVDELSLGAKQRVLECERHYAYLQSLEDLSGHHISRSLKTYTINDDPCIVAQEISKLVESPLVSRSTSKRDTLKIFISSLAEAGIYVYEFIDRWNKTEKANIDGIFLSPGFIGIKRVSDANLFSREIFTLAHEFGHYLLNDEQAERVELEKSNVQNSIEKWCDKFAFSYLLGSFMQEYMSLEDATSSNDYHHEFVDKVYSRTGLSKRAIFYSLLKDGKLSVSDYRLIKNDLENVLELAKKKQKERYESSSFIPSAKPIKSPLVLEIAEASYSSGVMNIVQFEAITGYELEHIKQNF